MAPEPTRAELEAGMERFKRHRRAIRRKVERANAYNRALRKLKKIHPDDFLNLYQKELKKGWKPCS